MAARGKQVDLVFTPRKAGVTLTQWLYSEIRNAILERRLRRGAPLPPTRALAAQHHLSRRIVVNVFDQLQDEGYLTALTGSGTRVSENIPEDYLPQRATKLHRTTVSPARFRNQRLRPFFPYWPALSEFPVQTWARLEARSLRRASTSDLAEADPAGNRMLRSAIAAHLGAARGVPCSADQIVITSGTQQSLDLLARLLVRRGDRVWIEDPGYKDAADIFSLAGARIVPVPVDAGGLVMPASRKPVPRAVYLTPAHQFPLGVSLRIDRRLELLRWTREHGVILIEDDYDSEFRFSGRPLPAMKGLPDSSHAFLLGTFNKALFPTLRLGYIVAPDVWLEPLIRLRNLIERYPAALPQRTMAAFLDEGHFSRHLRRMRELCGARLAALRDAIRRQLDGAITLPEIEAGLNIAAFLEGSLSAENVVEAGEARKLELVALDGFAFERNDLNGLLLGFAPFTEREIRAAVATLAQVISETRMRRSV